MRTGIAALAIVLAASASPSRAQKGQTEPEERSLVEQQLLAAMVYSSALGSRIVSPGAAITAYIDGGYVARKPDQRRDYVDYRALKKPATLLGHKLLVIEEEYLVFFIGCCVNKGVKATVEISGDDGALKAFAAENRCKLSEENGKEALGVLGLHAAGRVVEIRCGDWDAVPD